MLGKYFFAGLGMSFSLSYMNVKKYLEKSELDTQKLLAEHQKVIDQVSKTPAIKWNYLWSCLLTVKSFNILFKIFSANFCISYFPGDHVPITSFNHIYCLFQQVIFLFFLKSVYESSYSAGIEVWRVWIHEEAKVFLELAFDHIGCQYHVNSQLSLLAKINHFLLHNLVSKSIKHRFQWNRNWGYADAKGLVFTEVVLLVIFDH